MIGEYKLKLIGKDSEVKWEGKYNSKDFDLQELYRAIMSKIKDQTIPNPEELKDIVIESEDSLQISYESGE
jgi:hypothetical protein